MRRNTSIAIMFTGMAVASYAQWVNYPAPRIPRTRDGKPNLSARAPRAADGKPDLSGVWQVEPTPFEEMKRLFGDVTVLSVPGDDPRDFSKYAFNVLADFPPQEAPLRPEAAKVLRQRMENLGTDNPTARCLPAGVPFVYLLPFPFKVIQTPGLIATLFEADGSIRQIYTDGRKHPADAQPLWLGYSVGNWEGDKLLVHTDGFNDKTWLDALGHPHSESLHVTMGFRRRDFGHMDVEVTIDDPKMYTKPFTVSFTERLHPDTDILEAVCAENEKDLGHLKK